MIQHVHRQSTPRRPVSRRSASALLLVVWLTGTLGVGCRTAPPGWAGFAEQPVRSAGGGPPSTRNHPEASPAAYTGEPASDPAPQPAENSPTTGPDRRLVALARLSERRGLYERAQKLYRGIIERDPKMGFAYHRLGVLAAKAQNFADAERYFKQALRLGSQNRAELLSDLGYCYYLDNRLEEAERTLSEALKQRPTDKKTCNNLALAIGAQGRFGECLSLFRRIGSEAEAHANLAYVLAQHGRFKEAEAAYLQALTLDTSLRPAGEALVQLVAHKRGIELADLEAQAPGPPRKQPAAPSAGGEGVHPGTENASHHSTAAAAGPNHPSTATGDARRLPGTREAAGDRPRTSPSAKQREILGDVQSPSRPTRRVVLPAQPSGPSGGRAADVPTWEHRPPRQRFPAQPVPAAHRWPPGKEATNAAAVNPAAYTYQPIGVRSPIVPRATEAPSGALPSPSASPRPQGP